MHVNFVNTQILHIQCPEELDITTKVELKLQNVPYTTALTVYVYMCDCMHYIYMCICFYIDVWVYTVVISGRNQKFEKFKVIRNSFMIKSEPLNNTYIMIYERKKRNT